MGPDGLSVWAETAAEAAFQVVSEARTTADEIARAAATLRALTAHGGSVDGQRGADVRPAGPKRLGTSKARADQLIRVAKAAASAT